MTLASGTRLGTYEVIDLLGVGGMGEVYRARDTKLGRMVAIKVLLEALSFDPDRVARFEREAKVLASLNHPYIAALFGMEAQATASGPVHFLIMELVEGDTLADRLRRGPIPLEETLRIALQVSEALEVAHEKGIVHRDLKPANVKVGLDDRVKVLDFGLAKAMERDVTPANLSHSPTLSVMATQAGMILGTAAYMSPEQAKGLPADHRSDVFSFGVVLYEMLTGRQAFQGETAPDILASVLARDADLGGLPSTLNPRLLELLKRCLEKPPRKRWQAIGDVRAELEVIAANPRPLPSVSTTIALAPRPLWKRAIPILSTAIVVCAITAGVMWRLRTTTPMNVARFTITLPENQAVANARAAVAISPDGTHMAYAADRRLYIRSLPELEARPITPADNQPLNSPVFSPDGQSIAYWTDGTIKRMAISGGSPFTICQLVAVGGTGGPFGIRWIGESLFFGGPDGIKRVSANGGKPEMVAAAKEGEIGLAAPQLMPDGESLLYMVAGVAVRDVGSEGRIVSESLKSHERKTLIEGGSNGQYLPTGHLVYAVGGVLFAVPFDIKRMAPSGSPTPILEGVRRSGPAAQVAISDTGSLVYIPGPASTTTGQVSIGLFDRKGVAELLKLPVGAYQLPRLSPDGKRVAFGTDDGKDATIWVYELSASTAPRRLTFEGQGRNRFPVWSADSQRVTFQSDREKDLGIFVQRADGTGTAERLTKADEGTAHTPEAWSPNEERLLYNVSGKDSTSLWIHSSKDKKSERFDAVESPATALTGAVFSPDGKWVAYASRQGRTTSAVYVQPFPSTGAKYQVSRNEDDGHHPVWSPDGTELFFTPGIGARLNAVHVSTQPALTFGEAVSIARPFSNSAPGVERPFDISRDGRFLGLIDAAAAQAGTTGTTAQIQVVLNWFEELKARVPTR